MAALLQIPALVALGETKEGSCQLKQGEAFDKDVFTVQVGQKIKGTCKFCIQDFFGQKIINAGVEIRNTSDKTMHCQYYVAFFDKDDKLIGCAGQGTFGEKGLAAGKTTQFGSCLIPLPAGLHEKAVRYQIAFYESDRQIGEADRESGKAASTVRTPDAQVHRSGEGPSYREVRKDITKYVGKRVAWVGKYVSSSCMSMTVNGKTSDSTQEYRYALVDKKGKAVVEDSFCFSHPGTKKDTKRTPAAQAADNNPRDNGIRLIRGTIAGSKTIQIPGSGDDWRSIEVPDLKDVVIAMPPKRNRQ
jgi:hypothetical protein